MSFIAIINGPNLNLVGRRRPEIYGSTSLETAIQECAEICDSNSISLCSIQSNCEGNLIDTIQEWGYDPECVGIVINPGALAHYSHSLADALEAIPAPAIEVHISNIHSREEFRHTSVTARAVKGIISGFGLDGYAMAVANLIKNFKESL